MKRRVPLLTVSFLALTASPALAQEVLYDNGPPNGTTDAWTVNFGYVVSNEFQLKGFIDKGFDLLKIKPWFWEAPGDTLTSVGWSVTSEENGGTVFGSGIASGANLTDQFVSTNQYGYNIDQITISGLNVQLSSGTYWLNLQNAVVPSGDPVYWDENSGAGCGGYDGQGGGCPSQASESAVGTIPSEAFQILGTTNTGSTPEPSSVMLFVTGILSFAGMLRRKLF